MSKGYDTALEGRVKQWIEGSIGHPLEGATLRDGLLDMYGICELANIIQPGKIPKPHKSKIAMMRRENFGWFQRACQDFGVRENECCSFEDINDDKNMSQCLFMFVALARNVQFKPEWKGPLLPDAKEEKKGQKVVLTEEQKLRAALAPTMQEREMRYGDQVKDEVRYVEHGVDMNPDWNKK